MIALCRKCYCGEADNGKVKASSKRGSKTRKQTALGPVQRRARGRRRYRHQQRNENEQKADVHLQA